MFSLAISFIWPLSSECISGSNDACGKLNDAVWRKHRALELLTAPFGMYRMGWILKGATGKLKVHA